MNNYIAIPLMTALLFVLGGCNRAEDPGKVQADVAKVQADGDKKVADAQSKVNKVLAENPNASTDPKDRDRYVDAVYDLDKTKAQAAYDVAVERCKTRSGDDQKNCKDQAKVDYDRSVTAAQTKRDAAKK